MSAADDPTALEAVQQLIVVGRFADALAALEARSDTGTANADALYLRAVSHRCLGQFDQALAALGRLKAIAPDNGRAHQEEGHVHRDAGRDELALAAYARATHSNAALVAAWREQARILREAGRRDDARAAAAELSRIEALPKPLIAVVDLVAQGRLLTAEDVVRRFLKTNPTHVEAMRLLADIGLRLGVLDDAEVLLAAAARFEPDNVAVRIDYVQALRKRQKFAEALAEAEKLLDAAPDNAQFRSIVAVECMHNGDYVRAVAEFDRVLEARPGDPVTWTSRAHALKTSGRYEEAVTSYRRALEALPHYGEAWYSLANLKVYEFSDTDVTAMREFRTNDNLAPVDRVFLSFALGKALDDRDVAEEAFDHYARGNAIKKAQSRYDSKSMSADLAAQESVCSEALFAARDGVGCPAEDPIFIVGLPRAGSTLLEQILASHSRVDGTMELPNVLTLVQRLRRPARSGKATAYPEVLAELSDDELREMGETYIEETRIHRRGAAFFIDKMPNNFRHLGLIRLMLPNAKVIDARRHPMACGFSAFRQLFAEGQAFSYDLRDLGRYYRDYANLMDHFDRVLPGFVLRVQHEDVVADLAGSVRRLLDFCGLPFESQCLEFHRTRRDVRTPSSEQVRRPIYRSGLDAWRRFEPWLDPLKEALGGDVRQRFDLN